MKDAKLQATLNRIESQLAYLTALMEARVDDAFEVREIRQRMIKMQEVNRQLEYENWFEKNKK